MTLTFDPRLEEADDVTLLGLVIVGGVDLGPELLLLDDGLLLVLAGLARLLGCLVLVLAVVHDLADRRLGVRGGNFDEVKIGIRGDAKSVFDAHDATCSPAGPDESDFRYADALVDTGLSADGGASLVRFLFRPPRRSHWGTAGEKPRHQREGPACSRAQCRPITADAACETAEQIPLRYLRPDRCTCGNIRGRRWEWDSTCCPWRTPGRSCMPV